MHDRHQLSFATRRAFAMGIDQRTWVVPPPRALWIPAGVWDSVKAIGPTEMRALWIDPSTCPLTVPVPLELYSQAGQYDVYLVRDGVESNRLRFAVGE